MTNCVRALSLALALLGTGLAQAPAPAQAPTKAPAMIEQIIAKVNGDIITRSEYEQELKTIEGRIRAANVPADRLQAVLEEQKASALRDLIDQQLLVQKGKELDVNVDGEVTKYLARIQSENKIADPDKFQEWIRVNTGMSYEDFRSDVRDRMLTQRVIGSEVSSKINIPRTDIEKYYNEHKSEFVRKERIFLREILVNNATKDEAGLAAAEKARSRASAASSRHRWSSSARASSADSACRASSANFPLSPVVLSPRTANDRRSRSPVRRVASQLPLASTARAIIATEAARTTITFRCRRSWSATS